MANRWRWAAWSIASCVLVFLQVGLVGGDIADFGEPVTGHGDVERLLGHRAAVGDQVRGVDCGALGAVSRNGFCSLDEASDRTSFPVGLRPRDGGAITVAGMDPAREGVTFRQVLGTLLQESGLPDTMSVTEVLDLYASFYPEPHDPTELLERLGIVEQRRTYFGDAGVVRVDRGASVDLLVLLAGINAVLTGLNDQT